MKFTDTWLASVKPINKRQEFYEPNGFGLVVFPGGSKTFYYRYMIHGKARKLKLGNYPALTLAKARKAHAEAIEKVQNAREHHSPDPVIERKQRIAKAIGEITVQDLSVDWIADKRALGIVKADEYERTFNADILPHLKELKAKDVTKRMLLSILDKKKIESPGQAREILKVLRNMFSFAAERDIVQASPCVGISQPAAYVPRERALSTDELSSLLKVIPSLRVAETMRLMIGFIILNLLRQGEARLAVWKEFDLKARLWTIPANRIKTRRKANRDFIIPLTKQSVEILEEAIGFSDGSGFVFPSPVKRGSYNPSAIDHAINANMQVFAAVNIAHFTPHDLRRTGATRLGELGVQPHILDRLLNHSDQSTTGIYNVFEYLPEKKSALELWANRLDELTG